MAYLSRRQHGAGLRFPVYSGLQMVTLHDFLPFRGVFPETTFRENSFHLSLNSAKDEQIDLLEKRHRPG
jgi:hypothetical protein